MFVSDQRDFAVVRLHWILHEWKTFWKPLKIGFVIVVIVVYSPLFPTPCAPITAIFTSDNEDFFRRIPRVVILIGTLMSHVHYPVSVPNYLFICLLLFFVRLCCLILWLFFLHFTRIDHEKNEERGNKKTQARTLSVSLVLSLCFCFSVGCVFCSVVDILIVFVFLIFATKESIKFKWNVGKSLLEFFFVNLESGRERRRRKKRKEERKQKEKRKKNDIYCDTD